MLAQIKGKIAGSKSFINFSIIKILAQGIFAIMPLVVAKFLNPAGFGSYSLALMVVLFFVALFINASQTPFVVYANEENKEQNKINKSFSGQVLVLLISVALFFVLTLVFKKYLITFAQISGSEFYYLFLAFLGISLKTFILNIFLALNKRTVHAVYEFLYSVFCVILVVIFVAMGVLSLKSVLLLYFLAAFLALIFVIHKFDLKKLFPFAIEKAGFKKFLSFTLWQMFGLSAVYFINWGGNLALRAFVKIEDIGVYNLAFQIFNGLIGLTFILDAYFLPFLSGKTDDTGELRKYLYKKRPQIFILGAVCIIIGFVAAPYFFRLIYGSVYQGSSGVLQILLVANLVFLYTVFYIPLFNSLKKYKFIQIVNIVQVVINLALSFLLVYFWGYIGAAVANVISYITRSIAFEIYFRLKIKNKLAV